MKFIIRISLSAITIISMIALAIVAMCNLIHPVKDMIKYAAILYTIIWLMDMSYHIYIHFDSKYMIKNSNGIDNDELKKYAYNLYKNADTSKYIDLFVLYLPMSLLMYFVLLPISSYAWIPIVIMQFISTAVGWTSGESVERLYKLAFKEIAF